MYKAHDYEGFHAIGDIVLNVFPENIEKIFKESIKFSNLNIVEHVSKKFEPQGVTEAFILSESHATIHTYPEHNYVTVDIYTCGEEGDPLAAINNFASLLDIKKSNIKLIKRGDFSEEEIVTFDKKELTESIEQMEIGLSAAKSSLGKIEEIIEDAISSEEEHNETIPVDDFSFWLNRNNPVAMEMQQEMDDITDKLSKDEVENLRRIMEWCAEQSAERTEYEMNNE